MEISFMPTHKTKYGKLDPIMKNFIYRRQVTLLAGAPYSGKSTSVLKRIAVPLASGTEDLFGMTQPPLKVLFCSERDWEFNSGQLESLNIPQLPENLHFFCQPDIPREDKIKFDFDPLGYVSSTCITPDFKPDLAVLDTVQLFLSRQGSVSVNDYTTARKQMEYAKAWSMRHNMGTLTNFHAPKQNAKNEYEDPFSKVLGSTAFIAATVGAAIIERCSDGFSRIHFISHISKLETPRYFRYGDFVEVGEDVALASVLDKDKDIKYMTMSEREAQYFKLIPFEPSIFVDINKHICKELEIEVNNGRNLANRLVDKGLVAYESAPESGEKLIRKNRVS
jgi:hypothetical protein